MVKQTSNDYCTKKCRYFCQNGCLKNVHLPVSLQIERFVTIMGVWIMWTATVIWFFDLGLTGAAITAVMGGLLCANLKGYLPGDPPPNGYKPQFGKMPEGTDWNYD